MIATISSKGDLRIHAESEIEAFALQSWWAIQQSTNNAAFTFGIDLGEWDDRQGN